MVLGALCLIASALVVGPLAAAPAGAAGPGQYSPPDWLPLRYGIDGSKAWQGCTFQSPAPECWLRGTNHHPTWAIDFLVPKGTLVYAAGAGRVVQVHRGEPGCSPQANYVDVDHDPGGDDGQWSNYWHLDQVFVSVGDWVDENTVLGTVGDTGMGGSRSPDHNGECGPHLHYVEPFDYYTERRDPGRMLACHGGTLVEYPYVEGYQSWAHIRWGSFQVYSDGTGCRGTPGPSGFYDVQEGHPFGVEIAWMVDEGLTTGYPDATFRPATWVFRQTLAAFLYRYSGSPQGTQPACAVPPFDDVGDWHPFCGEISWMASNGLAEGYDDGTFRPEDPVTRQAVVAFLHRISGAPRTPCAVAPFLDVQVDHPFCPEIAWATESGVAQGFAEGTFRPGDPVTRQAAAAFLHRTSKL